jgi:Rhs element Vgr protein
VQGVGPRDVIVLSTNASVELASLLGRQAALAVSLADGSRTQFHGEITQAAMLGSEGGLARFRLRLTPWLWRLSQVRNSRVWQDKTVVDIIDDVFEGYAPRAQWRWSEEAEPFMADAVARSYCCQYRESDLDFVQRLLTEEGLAWRYEQLDDGVGVVLFADSSQPSATPEDASSKAGGASATMACALARRAIHSGLAIAPRRDGVADHAAELRLQGQAAVSASAPSSLQSGKLPALESYDVPGQYAYANARRRSAMPTSRCRPGGGRPAVARPFHGAHHGRPARASR